MDRNTLFECLVAWVNTFNLNILNKKVESSNDLKDGIVIAKCLNNIDPDYFNDEWVSKIKSDTNENWRLKLLNLKKILQTLTDYYSEVLNQSLNDFDMPNLNLIVESTNNSEIDEELSHLLQLVLGCAVNCVRKSEFIKNIMEMNESTQHMIMTAIQDLMSKDRNTITKSSSNLSPTTNNNVDDLGYQLIKLTNELNRITEQKEDIDRKCKSFDLQVSALQDEKMALISEIEMLKEKLQREDLARIDPNNDANKHLKQEQRIHEMIEELYRVDAEKEKYKINFEAAKAEQAILIEKNIELKKLAQDAQLLKDEIDVLKHTSDKVEKLESAIEAYKIKLEEMADIKKQIKQLEEMNSKYLERIIQMEEEVKKINTLKSQIEMYKKQIQELHEQILNDEMKMKKLEYEYKSAEESLVSLKQDKERIQNEYERLKNSHEKLELSAHAFQTAKEISSDENSSTQNMDGLFSSVELVNIPAETKEKIIRLYHENKMLKSKQNDLSEERFMLVQTQYEDEKQRNNDLQTKLNETSKQKIELECHLNDLKKKDNENNNYLKNYEQQLNNLKLKDETINDLKSKLNTLNIQLEEECKKNETITKNYEKKIESIITEKEEIKELKDKEIQMREKETAELSEKYRLYLEKAKIVIKSLDPKHNATSEIQYLKSQLNEKDKIIKQLTKDNEKIKSSREQEEQLIASAWYHLGANLNRRATDERITTIGSSFLSQQRHLPSSSSSTSSILNSSRRHISVSGTPIITNTNNNNGGLKLNLLNQSVQSNNQSNTSTAI